MQTWLKLKDCYPWGRWAPWFCPQTWAGWTGEHSELGSGILGDLRGHRPAQRASTAGDCSVQSPWTPQRRDPPPVHHLGRPAWDHSAGSGNQIFHSVQQCTKTPRDSLIVIKHLTFLFWNINSDLPTLNSTSTTTNVHHVYQSKTPNNKGKLLI